MSAGILQQIRVAGGVKSIDDDDLCATCKNCDYRPGEMSGCSEGFPGEQDPDGYFQECAAFAERDAPSIDK